MAEKAKEKRGNGKPKANKKAENKGRPRVFKTDKDFYKKFIDYLQHCKNEKELPNIAGFCVFCDITRDTFYAQQEYYSDTYKKINEALENATINSRDINDTFKIFYMKNKFGYKDKQEIENTGEVKIKIEGYNSDYSK